MNDADKFGDKIRAFSNDQKFSETEKNVEQILAKTVRANAGTISPAILNQKDVCFVIHVVEYGDTPENIKSNSWYLYHPGISFQDFTGQRIYGSKHIVVLFLHLNAKGLESPGLKSLAKAEQDALAANLLFDNDPKNALQIQGLGDGAIDSAYAQVHYEAAVVKKTAANIQNLLSILKTLNLAQGELPGKVQVMTTPVIVWGSGAIQDAATPSDIRVAGYNLPTGDPNMATARDAHQVGADVSLDNEGKYWWDASIGIPVNKIKDLQYSSTDNMIQATQVSKQSAYAMFNLMLLGPVDLKAPNSNLRPRILLGFPLTSDPWDKLFAGGGIGLPKIMVGSQFFAGAVFNRVSTPTSLIAGSSASQAQLANDSRLKIQYKFMFGINVPVKSVIDKLK